MTKEALTLALECAERCEAIDEMYSWSATITVIKEALAQRTEQEPVAYFNPQVKGGFYWAKPTKITAPVTVSVEPIPLYTTPPQRTWVGLTEDDKVLIKHDANFNQFMTAGEYADRVQELTEARIKDKNT